ncbi:tRNA uracil 4-sulfurtransferase ThiI [Candidatus Mycoplasma mahonii]|uniref:tRNA uracil 4-sulfurtransferase ThiI n=1 Tax=Candidatus Mycoplasma mahonii TaxID=3004105 RepID=UPI0026F06548|nr:tRNA uracil 4-sulfurtransferase ThiI [Candidatus Mycoplasma mahonii]WKX02696.1 tRNA 4-thiouridine(8) synthase ThiI [Candidatus Mycoplasma mahonii]
MYTNILLRFGELSTKGKNKMTFVRHLEKNIKALICDEPDVLYDRMFLKYSDDALKKLNYIFGLQSFSPVVKVDTDITKIKKCILTLIKPSNKKTFKVITKRHWKGFGKSSMDFSGEIGGFILENTDMKVDVKNPELKVEIEIRDDFSYVFVKRFSGLGGYPTGINGKVLHMMSGGIDSPIAALEMMKRGIHVDFLNFITPPHTDKRTVDKVNNIINLLIKYQGSAILYRSTYTNLMYKLAAISNPAYKITLMRRSFYRIGAAIAFNKNYQGISNGENLGQVASQTLESMSVIQEVMTIPVYRPILTSDKIETINKAIKVGTYSLSIGESDETCEMFAPKAPVIKPALSVAKKLESEISDLIELENKNIENLLETKHFKLS